MTGWNVLVMLLVAALGACGALVLRRAAASALVAAELASVVAVLALVFVAVADRLSYMFDVAVVVAALSFAGSLVFASYLDAL